MVVTNISFRSRIVLIFFIHALVVAGAHLLAYLARFDGGPIPPNYLDNLPLMVLVPVPFYLASFVLFGIHRGLWRYINIRDVLTIGQSVTLGFVASVACYAMLSPSPALPRSIPVLGAVFVGLGTISLRLTVRVLRERHRMNPKATTPMLIYGAGDAASFLISEMNRVNGATWYPVGVVDDNPELTGARIGGVRILGTGADLERLAREAGAKEIVIAIPSASRQDIARIAAQCVASGLVVSTMPSMRSILVDDAKVTDLKRINLEDLLSRDPIQSELVARESFAGKRVLVTGAGGSIGSELCRQLFALGPDELIMVDRYENALAAIALEFASKEVKETVTRAVIGDVTDGKRMRHVFERFRPHYVYHAAAHKHVPMMEWNPLEAIKNNIVGTQIVAQIAHEYQADHFTLVSTDKAVNPTNVMGATKRAAEFVIKGMTQVSQTSFCAVRFGNVLGSNGSVVPIFQEQIKAGGPVTVTHPEIRRFFMTIPEAVNLVIQSGCVSQGGETFVLDMGEQVPIVDLARRLIQLHGYQPDKDIAITFTGLRPGEKLYEELFDASEHVETTDYTKLMRARGGDIPPLEQMEQMLTYLMSLPAEKALQEAPHFLSYMVPSYCPDVMESYTPWAQLFPMRPVLSECRNDGIKRREDGECGVRFE